jgi:hypothetical protein
MKNRDSLPTKADSLQRWAIAFTTPMLYNNSSQRGIALRCEIQNYPNLYAAAVMNFNTTLDRCFYCQASPRATICAVKS